MLAVLVSLLFLHPCEAGDWYVAESAKSCSETCMTAGVDLTCDVAAQSAINSAATFDALWSEVKGQLEVRDSFSDVGKTHFDFDYAAQTGAGASREPYPYCVTTPGGAPASFCTCPMYQFSHWHKKQYWCGVVKDSTCDGKTGITSDATYRICKCCPPAGCAAPGAGGALVEGDPITVFKGIEYKFLLPENRFSTLLVTSEFVVRAFPFHGEKSDEQWIERVLVESRTGTTVVDVRIRKDIGISQPREGSLESLEVFAPWVSSELLTLPSRSEDMVAHGSIMYDPVGWQTHAEGVSILVYRMTGDRPEDRLLAHIEGVLIVSDGVKMIVRSSSAWEYYYESSDADLAMKYAHLDVDFFDMNEELSTLTGLLPEVWGLTNSSNSSLATNSSEDELHSQQKGDRHAMQERITRRRAATNSSSSRQGLLSNILKDMLELPASVSVTSGPQARADQEREVSI